MTNILPTISQDRAVELALTGCSPEPLLAYLKAIGILRVVAEQRDPRARGHWDGDLFHLTSALDLDRLCTFLLDDYRPTPIVSPWNGGSGFYAKDNQIALAKIAATTTERFQDYRETIAAVKTELGANALTKPETDDKPRLLRRLRARLPDSALPWLDVAAIETDERFAFSPLLGTGGNDGRLDFSQNFMQRLSDVLLTADRSLSERRLRLALLGIGACPLVEAAVGQFDPGGVGGPNAEPGFEAQSLVNPWDFVLMLEGAVLFGGAVARRYAGTPDLRATFPFMVRASAAGWGSVGTDDVRNARAELWLPLWHQPANLPDIHQLFAEGRAQVGRRVARNGVDFARAVASLGVDRGIAAFQRFGFHQRSGNTNYLAAPLGRLAVRGQADVHLLDELDPWLNRLRRLATKKETPRRFTTVLRQIDEAIFAYCRQGGPRHLQGVLAALGRAEQELALGPAIHETICPMQGLSVAWLRACDDGSPELRIGTAIASIGARSNPLRLQLEPVTRERNRWTWSTSTLGVVWGPGSLPVNLSAVLARRKVEGAKAGDDHGDQTGAAGANPELRGLSGVSLGDIDRFLVGGVDDQRIADLIWGLSALKWADYRREHAPRSRAELPPGLPRLYTLLKLFYLVYPIASAREDAVVIHTDPAIVPRLVAGDTTAAAGIAYHRLRALGFAPLGGTGREGREPPDFQCSPVVGERLAGALLIPIFQTTTLANLVLTSAESGAGST